MLIAPKLLVAALAHRCHPPAALCSPRFPAAATPPADVLAMQLRALRESDIPLVLKLFSRAQRTMFEDAGRAQSCPPSLQQVWTL